MNEKIKKKPFQELRKNWPLFLMVLPGFATLFLLNFLPLSGLVMAFKAVSYGKGLYGGAWIGFKNFEFLFKSPDAFLITRNTVVYNLIFIIFGTIISVIFAIMLSELRNRFVSKTYQTIMFLPHFLSWVVVSFLVFGFLNMQNGWINHTFFADQKPIDWYLTPSIWPGLVIFLGIWKSAGYNSVVYLASITGIDSELYEASRIDGANKLKQIWYITLPCIKPIIVIMTILAIGRIFRADFGLFYQVTLNSGPLYPVTNVLDTYVYRALSETGETGMATAAGLYQSVVGFILVLSSNLLVKKLDSDMALF